MKLENTSQFFSQVQTGKLLNDRQRLYSHIKKHPGITLGDLARATRIVLQTCSARVSELMDAGIVYAPGKTGVIGMVKSTMDSMLYVQEDPGKIQDNRKIRSEKKFHRAVKALQAFDEHLTDDLRMALAALLKKKK